MEVITSPSHWNFGSKRLFLYTASNFESPTWKFQSKTQVNFVDVEILIHKGIELFVVALQLADTYERMPQQKRNVVLHRLNRPHTEIPQNIELKFNVCVGELKLLAVYT